MRGFMREEIMPIETLDLSHDQALAFIKPLQDQVRERGLWAAHLPQEPAARDSVRSDWDSCTRYSARRPTARSCSATTRRQRHAELLRRAWR